MRPVHPTRHQGSVGPCRSCHSRVRRRQGSCLVRELRRTSGACRKPSRAASLRGNPLPNRSRSRGARLERRFALREPPPNCGLMRSGRQASRSWRVASRGLRSPLAGWERLPAKRAAGRRLARASPILRWSGQWWFAHPRAVQPVARRCVVRPERPPVPRASDRDRRRLPRYRRWSAQ